MASRVRTAQEFPRKSGTGIPVVRSLLVGAILAENFDLPQVVSDDDDVSTWMGRSRKVRRRCLRFQCVICPGGKRVLGGVLSVRLGRLGLADQSDRRRVAQIVDRVS